MDYQTRMIDGMTKAELKIKRRDYRALIQEYLRTAKLQGAKFIYSEDLAPGKFTLEARIDWGRWIVDCECGGAETVTAEDPVMYCISCGNAITGGKLRRVKFPSGPQMKKIEDLLLERPLDTSRGFGKVNKAMRSQPQVHRDPDSGRIHILSHSWDPGETLADLKSQNKKIKKSTLMGVKNG